MPFVFVRFAKRSVAMKAIERLTQETKDPSGKNQVKNEKVKGKDKNDARSYL